jgi:PPM family protein phosphatase
MTCSKCGAENPDIARFCSLCGEELEEPTQELAADSLGQYEPPPLRVVPVARVGAKTDLGRVRENNEDKFEFYEPSKPEVMAGRGSVYVVCDGMGGHAAGQIASELAAKTFLETYYRSPAGYIADAATAGVAEANRYVTDVAAAIPERRGMGTTMSALILCQDQALIVQVGDSRCYRLREGQIEQLTTDHTWVEEQVALGLMSREDAERSPYAHVITRAIGADPALRADLFTFTPNAGDKFLLCSDGLSNHVEADEIGQHLQEYGPSDACWRLVNLALERGGSDNCTVLVVDLKSLDAVDPTP